MKVDELKKSRWMRQARDPRSESHVLQGFPGWIGMVANSGLVDKAVQLKEYMVSGETSRADKALVVAALLYLICPFDLVPDVIPIVGWLDDVAVAAAVLAFLDNRLDSRRSC